MNGGGRVDIIRKMTNVIAIIFINGFLTATPMTTILFDDDDDDDNKERRGVRIGLER